MKQQFLLASILLLTACTTGPKAREVGLVQVSLLDHNGFSEMISSKDKLESFASSDFIEGSQPYKKVTRVYKTKEGKTRGVMTSYYSSGQIQQCLEFESGRASGTYREWHPTGNLKVKATLIGGQADLDPASVSTWIFDGLSKAYAETGELIAEITYEKGELSGPAVHYYKNGNLKSRLSYSKGLKSGVEETYFPSGAICSESNYLSGKLHKERKNFWPSGQLLALETWDQGRLIEARFWDQQGDFLEQLSSGKGLRYVIEADESMQRVTYVGGEPFGRVDNLNLDGKVAHYYHIKDGLKHGKEVYLFSPEGSSKLEIMWIKGLIQGEQKSWYPSGQLESLREFVKNEREGTSSAWYEDGSLMLSETYVKGKLIEGRYYPKGSAKAISEVKKGTGIATLFDGEGNFENSIRYEKSEPALD
jgi:antitoxin component YwqK of YwqJK toxin-antitoxin module